MIVNDISLSLFPAKPSRKEKKMSWSKNLPINEKISYVYTLITFTLFIGGFLWWVGVSGIPETNNHLRVIDAKNELMFRNF